MSEIFKISKYGIVMTYEYHNNSDFEANQTSSNQIKDTHGSVCYGTTVLKVRSVNNSSSMLTTELHSNREGGSIYLSL